MKSWPPRNRAIASRWIQSTHVPAGQMHCGQSGKRGPRGASAEDDLGADEVRHQAVVGLAADPHLPRPACGRPRAAPADADQDVARRRPAANTFVFSSTVVKLTPGVERRSIVRPGGDGVRERRSRRRRGRSRRGAGAGASTAMRPTVAPRRSRSARSPGRRGSEPRSALLLSSGRDPLVRHAGSLIRAGPSYPLGVARAPRAGPSPTAAEGAPESHGHRRPVRGEDRRAEGDHRDGPPVRRRADPPERRALRPRGRVPRGHRRADEGARPLRRHDPRGVRRDGPRPDDLRDDRRGALAAAGSRSPASSTRTSSAPTC